MSSNKLDTINTIINNKFSKLRKIIDLAKKSQDKVKTTDGEIEQIRSELEEVIDSYKLGSVEIVVAYYGNKSAKEKKEIIEKYVTFLHRENIIMKLNMIKSQLKKIFNTLSTENVRLYSKFMFFLKDYESYSLAKFHKCSNKFLYCSECDNIMIKSMTTSELICGKCGKIEKIFGVEIELGSSDFYRNKHGSYDPNKHCRFWIERILARETVAIPERVLDKIKKTLRRDRINYRRVSCYHIRETLKTINKTCYNEHISLIKKILTGRAPQQLSNEEIKKIDMYFTKVTSIFMKIKPKTKINVPYHPYIIFKIIEQIIPNGERKSNILSHIYLQSKEASIDKDKLWKKICTQISGFKYIPTYRNRYDY